MKNRLLPTRLRSALVAFYARSGSSTDLKVPKPDFRSTPRSGHARERQLAPIVLKNSKIAELRKSRKCHMWSIQPMQGSVKPIRASAGVFAVIDVVPRIKGSKAHQRL
jgi:hypothetical protein